MVKRTENIVDGLRDKLAADDVEVEHVLVMSLLGVCDCVPPALVGAYYNPLTMAVTAMLVPNLVRLSLMVRKYAPKAKDRVLGAIKHAIKQRCGDTTAGRD